MRYRRGVPLLAANVLPSPGGLLASKGRMAFPFSVEGSAVGLISRGQEGWPARPWPARGYHGRLLRFCSVPLMAAPPFRSTLANLFAAATGLRAFR